jgi:hypothetical protein
VILRILSAAISSAAAAALVLLQACSSTAVNPTQSLVLGPGEGYAAIQLDLGEPNKELLFASQDTEQHIQIDDPPAGRSLYLFPVPAGRYCMSMYYIAGRAAGQKLYPKNMGCFEIESGKLTFSGFLTPALISGNTAVGQIRDDAAGQAELRRRHPEIASRYFGAAPEGGAPAPAPVALTAPINGCYAVEPAVVALTGTFMTETIHTPIKNNSVTGNKIERILVLSFTPPICTVGNLQQGGIDRPYPDIHDIQLIYPGGDSKLYEAIG